MSEIIFNKIKNQSESINQNNIYKNIRKHVMFYTLNQNEVNELIKKIKYSRIKKIYNRIINKSSNPIERELGKKIFSEIKFHKFPTKRKAIINYLSNFDKENFNATLRNLIKFNIIKFNKIHELKMNVDTEKRNKRTKLNNELHLEPRKIEQMPKNINTNINNALLRERIIKSLKNNSGINIQRKNFNSFEDAIIYLNIGNQIYMETKNINNRKKKYRIKQRFVLDKLLERAKNVKNKKIFKNISSGVIRNYELKNKKRKIPRDAKKIEQLKLLLSKM